MGAAFPSLLVDIILLHLLTIMYSTNFTAVITTSHSSLLSSSSPALLIYIIISSIILYFWQAIIYFVVIIYYTLVFKIKSSASKNILRRRVICYRLVNWCSGSNAVTSPPAPSTGAGSGMISGDDCRFANPIFKNYYHIL